MLAILKRQQFYNSKTEDMALIVYKHQRFDERDNEEKQSLNEDEGDIYGDWYISFSFTALPFLP